MKQYTTLASNNIISLFIHFNLGKKVIFLVHLKMKDSKSNGGQSSSLHKKAIGLNPTHGLRREADLEIDAAAAFAAGVARHLPIELVPVAAAQRQRLPHPELAPVLVEPRRAPHHHALRVKQLPQPENARRLQPRRQQAPHRLVVVVDHRLVDLPRRPPEVAREQLPRRGGPPYRVHHVGEAFLGYWRAQPRPVVGGEPAAGDLLGIQTPNPRDGPPHEGRKGLEGGDFGGVALGVGSGFELGEGLGGEVEDSLPEGRGFVAVDELVVVFVREVDGGAVAVREPALEDRRARDGWCCWCGGGGDSVLGTEDLGPGVPEVPVRGSIAQGVVHGTTNEDAVN